MKKGIITLLLTLALIIVLPLTVFAENSDYVVDNGNLLSESEEDALEIKLANLSEKYSFDIVALTVSSLDGKSAMEYADDYYDYNGYRNDGCLLLISTDRDWWISTKGFGITAITDYGIDVIEQEVIHPYFGDDNWSGGFNKYADVVEDFVVQAKGAEAYDTNNFYTNDSGYTYKNKKSFFGKYDVDAADIVISLIVALIIALVIAKIVKGNYKPVRFKASASDYLVDGSLHLTDEYDRFLYSNVSKTKIETESSSGGGSSTHTSSSGSTHGGGGGKF